MWSQNGSPINGAISISTGWTPVRYSTLKSWNRVTKEFHCGAIFAPFFLVYTTKAHEFGLQSKLLQHFVRSKHIVCVIIKVIACL